VLGGGCELVMLCDLTIAADNATFGEPEVRFSSVGPAIVMPMIIGYKKARELLYFGDQIDAQTALSLGMMAFFGINVVFPLWLQTTLGYTATWAGLATAPVGILAFLMSPVIGANINRMDLRMVVTAAFLVFAGTSLWFSSFDSSASFATLVLPRFVMGAGIACFFIPLNQIYLAGLPGDQIASASGLANFCRTMGSSVSTAVTVTIWQHRGEFHHAILTESVSPAHPAATQYLQGLAQGGLSGARGLGVVDQVLTREALTLAVNDVFWLCAVLFVALIPMIWFARPPFGSAGGAAGH